MLCKFILIPGYAVINNRDTQHESFLLQIMQVLGFHVNVTVKIKCILKSGRLKNKIKTATYRVKRCIFLATTAEERSR